MYCIAVGKQGSGSPLISSLCKRKSFCRVLSNNLLFTSKWPIIVHWNCSYILWHKEGQAGHNACLFLKRTEGWKVYCRSEPVGILLYTRGIHSKRSQRAVHGSVVLIGILCEPFFHSKRPASINKIPINSEGDGRNSPRCWKVSPSASGRGNNGTHPPEPIGTTSRAETTRASKVNELQMRGGGKGEIESWWCRFGLQHTTSPLEPHSSSGYTSVK